MEILDDLSIFGIKDKLIEIGFTKEFLDEFSIDEIRNLFYGIYVWK